MEMTDSHIGRTTMVRRVVAPAALVVLGVGAALGVHRWTPWPKLEPFAAPPVAHGRDTESRLAAPEPDPAPTPAERARSAAESAVAEAEDLVTEAEVLIAAADDLHAAAVAADAARAAHDAAIRARESTAAAAALAQAEEVARLAATGNEEDDPPPCAFPQCDAVTGRPDTGSGESSPVALAAAAAPPAPVGGPAPVGRPASADAPADAPVNAPADAEAPDTFMATPDTPADAAGAPEGAPATLGAPPADAPAPDAPATGLPGVSASTESPEVSTPGPAETGRPSFADDVPDSVPTQVTEIAGFVGPGVVGRMETDIFGNDRYTVGVGVGLPGAMAERTHAQVAPDAITAPPSTSVTGRAGYGIGVADAGVKGTYDLTTGRMVGEFSAGARVAPGFQGRVGARATVDPEQPIENARVDPFGAIRGVVGANVNAALTRSWAVPAPPEERAERVAAIHAAVPNVTVVELTPEEQAALPDVQGLPASVTGTLGNVGTEDDGVEADPADEAATEDAPEAGESVSGVPGVSVGEAPEGLDVGFGAHETGVPSAAAEVDAAAADASMDAGTDVDAATPDGISVGEAPEGTTSDPGMSETGSPSAGDGLGDDGGVGSADESGDTGAGDTGGW
jgi:hypothetical protein